MRSVLDICIQERLGIVLTRDNSCSLTTRFSHQCLAAWRHFQVPLALSLHQSLSLLLSRSRSLARSLSLSLARSLFLSLSRSLSLSLSLALATLNPASGGRMSSVRQTMPASERISLAAVLTAALSFPLTPEARTSITAENHRAFDAVKLLKLANPTPLPPNPTP